MYAKRNKMKILHRVFPVGVVLTIGGVLFIPLIRVDHNYAFGIIDQLGDMTGLILLVTLLGGSLLMIAGSFIDRRLPVAKTKPRGRLCWFVCIGSILPFVAFRLGFDDPIVLLIFPAFAGLVGGAVLSSRA
jgi:hypothetical protein